MPELPDVKTLKRYMDATSLHRKIRKTRVLDDKVLRRTSPRSLQMKTKGKSFEGTRRHGK